MSIEFKTFLQLMYSFAKQYIAWYEREVKQKPVTNSTLESGAKVV